MNCWAVPHLLHSQEHGAVPGPQSSKVGQEAIVEGREPSTPEALHKAIHQSAVLPSLVTCFEKSSENKTPHYLTAHARLSSRRRSKCSYASMMSPAQPTQLDLEV